VTAQLLVRAILDAGEDPKHFLRNLAPRDFPPLNEVEFGIDVQWEGDVDPADQFDNPEDVAWVRQQIDDGNIWGWCRVAVRAMWRDPHTGEEYEGWDYLGCCSYESEASFKQPGGYYDDMKKAAYDELQSQVEKAKAGE